MRYFQQKLLAQCSNGSTLVADRYDIVVTPDVAEDAKNLLIKYGWRTG